MITHEFVALGTRWAILLDHSLPTEDLFKQLENLYSDFEIKYSRFIDSSEVSQLNSSLLKTHKISKELTEMLLIGNTLYDLTDGYFTLSISSLLEAYGYDRSYSFKEEDEKIQEFSSKKIYLEKNKLTKEPSTHIDIGAIGKGYLIDMIANFLKENNYSHFLIDGGGDMFATQKHSGKAWNTGLSFPNNTAKILGTVKLVNKALAVSGSDKRRVGTFHHLLNPYTKRPVDEVIYTAVIAKNAAIADSCATALFVCPKKYWDIISKAFNIEYMVITRDGRGVMSKNFGISFE